MCWGTQIDVQIRGLCAGKGKRASCELRVGAEDSLVAFSTDIELSDGSSVKNRLWKFLRAEISAEKIHEATGCPTSSKK